MSTVRCVIRRNPLAVRYLAVAAVSLAAHFGVDLDTGQIVGLVLALAGVATADGQRKVTPVAEPRLPKSAKAQRY